MSNVNLSKLDRLSNFLTGGGQITAKQISNRFRVNNPYTMIYTLRNEGLDVINSIRVNSKGKVVRFYEVLPIKDTKSRRKAA